MIMEEENNPIDFGDELNNLDIPDDAFKKHKGKKNIDDFCETYICVFLVHLVQSLISMGCFYIYYIFKLQIKDFNLNRLISFGLIFLSLILFGLIYYFCESAFYFKHIKCGKYVIFILINILKIVFELPIYIMIIIEADPKQIAEFYGKKLDELDSSYLIDQLAFPQFEARIYWKVSMVLLYLILIFYYYFKKEKTTLKISISIFLLLSLIGLLIFFLLLFSTHKNNYDNNRYNYLFLMFLEIFYFWYGVIISSLLTNKKHHLKFFKYLDWKINKLDCAKYNGIIIIITLFSHLCYECMRCCTKIVNNYINK